MTNLFVVAVAAALIYRIGREVLGSTRHLSREEIAEYWSGELKMTDPKHHRRCSEHLGVCTECRDLLDEVRRTESGPGSTSPLIERKY